MRKLALIFLFCILGLIAFLPKIASTSIGKPFFIRAMESKGPGTIDIETMELSWFGPQIFKNISWEYGDLQGSADSFKIEAPFWSFSGPFKLKNGAISQKQAIVQSIDGELLGNTFQLTGATFNGHISLKGTLYSKLHFQVQVDVKNFPLVVLDHDLDELLGPTLNLFGSLSMNEGRGSVDLTAKTEHFETVLKGNLRDASLTLKKPLIAHLNLTPKLSSFLLKHANPIFINSMLSREPIVLRVETEGFSLPLPFSFEKLRVGKATLHLEQLIFSNGEKIAALISKLQPDQFLPVPTMTAWFSPLSFHIDRGVLKIDRTDALLDDSVHLSTWGRVDFIRDQLDLVLGIPADTLNHSFGIKDLPKNYMIKVDIRGSTKNPEVLKTPAMAKIATLMATGKLPKEGILGSLASIFSSPKVDEDVPEAPPSYPWDGKILEK